MNIITIIDAVDIFLSVLIFVLVVYKATKDKGSLFFLALLGLGATWSLESILDYSGVSVYFVNNCIFATALLILFSLSLFTYYFPQKVKFYNYKLLFVITFIVVFFVIGIFLGGVNN